MRLKGTFLSHSFLGMLHRALKQCCFDITAAACRIPFSPCRCNVEFERGFIPLKQARQNLTLPRLSCLIYTAAKKNNARLLPIITLSIPNSVLFYYYSEDLMVTAGATQGLHLVSTVMFDKDTPVFMEDPSYFIALKMLKEDFGMNIIPSNVHLFAAFPCYST